MIENVMERWFAVVSGNGDIRELLHEDCVFWSPVLFHPQVGADLTAMYLSAAGMVFPGDGEKEGSEGQSGSFKYTKKVFDGNHAVLEFETTMDGVSVNGVDIISCDND
ncbi:MAG: nuclear transport factor 2 family protein, partial [Actinomycetota bacterium]|nr:nuclear transport factor 2 family protein [Actinomycetota bacterium]